MTTTIRDRVQDHIVAVHAPDLAGETIPDDYDLVETGVVDSLALLELVEWIQEAFGVSAIDTEVTPADLSSIGAITAFVRDRIPRASEATRPAG